MESEDSKLVNGAANGEKAEERASESESESESDSGEEELETPKGSPGADDTIKNLHHEIQSLRRDRSELRRRIDDIRSEMDRSESESKSLAFHASYLEGELVRTQEDLAAASAAAAADADAELSLLKSSLKALEQSATAKEARIAHLETERVALTEAARVSKEESQKTVKELQQRNSELERKINTLLAENKTIGLELERSVKRSSELEGKIGEQKIRALELETAATVSRSSVLPLAKTVALAASTGVVAVSVTALYLRRQR